MKTLSMLSLGFLLASCKGSPDPEPEVPEPTPAKTPVAERGTVTSAAELSWEDIAPFVKMAGAWGNRESGEHGTFGRFPGGASSPPHTHSGAYHGVVISGTVTNPFGTEKNATEMTAGSYWHVPAGEQHVTACVSKDPCLFYFHADGAFDFAALEEPTNARSAEAVATAAADLTWAEIAPFVKMAPAWGNQESGAHGTFGRFAAGAKSPPHVHSGAYRGVVISGTMTNPFAGEKTPKEMGPGSYWDVPANSAHVTACVSDTPCLFYFHATGKFDFAPVE